MTTTRYYAVSGTKALTTFSPFPPLPFSAFPPSLDFCQGSQEHNSNLRRLPLDRISGDLPEMANAVSGMAVNDECQLKFLELKAKRTYRFIIYKIEEKQRQIVVEKVGEPNLTYEDFAAALPENECRYAIFDFDFVTAENCQKSKIFFIAWSPDTSKVRSKMLYASSKEQFKRSLDGIQVELQATDPSEMDLDVIRGRAN